jgi:CheY-like chemotaxis protein
MIVDDEPALVRLAEETLAKLGYEALGFHSSRAALDAFAADPESYDLILTDETMPELTGTQLAREIHKLRPDMPVMLMSGYRGEQLVASAQAAGVAGILQSRFSAAISPSRSSAFSARAVISSAWPSGSPRPAPNRGIRRALRRQQTWATTERTPT